MTVKRKHLHNRSIDVQGFLREDGLWEVEGRLYDTKTYDFDLPDKGRLKAAEPLHHMELRVAVDDTLTIKDVGVRMPATPYQDCSNAGKAYAALVGVQIKSGWMDEVKLRFARNQACTHITELLPVLATNLIQTIHGYRMSDEVEMTPEEAQTFRDTCYGLRAGGRADKINIQALAKSDIEKK